jgi:cytochrome P450/acyl-CoA synthetase (AMP-forming)/AMP-acid ligase II
MLAGHLNAMAPPKHTALRQILGPELAARALTRLEPKIKAATTELLDRAADKRALNFAEEVALALPVRIVLGELLGIPREDQPQVVRWSGAIAAPEDHTLSPTPDTPLRALEALYAYGLSRVRACRTSPREDLISILAQARMADGSPVTDELFLALWFPLILGAFDTTASTIAGGVLAMAKHPDQWQRLRAEPALLPKAVEEILRWVSPVLYFRRTATADVELRGQKIRQGQRVIMCYPSANRDEDIFDAPEVFDIGRSPNHHLSFGFGPHFCLGARIAQLQLTILFEAMSRRFQKIELAGTVQRVRSSWMNSIRGLPVELTPATNAGPKPAPTGTPSVRHGPRLRAENAPVSLARALRRAAKRSPGRGVVYVQEDGTEVFRSYPGLLCDAERVSAGLRELGIKPQDKVIVHLDRDEDFLTAFWGCALGGFVPVPVPPGQEGSDGALGKLRHVCQQLQRAVVVAGKSTAPALRSSSVLPDKQVEVVTLDALQACAPDGCAYDPQPDDLALVLLTSGSTGAPKGVMLTHANLLSMIRGMVQSSPLSEQDTLLNWLPLDHVGGIAFIHLLAVYLSANHVQLRKEFVLHDPLRWMEAVARHRASLTWAPNFAYALLNARAEEIQQRPWDLSSLRFLGNAGEAIVAKTARRTLELLGPKGLPPSAMRPMWGMSETASAAVTSARFSLASTTDDDAWVELGQPLPGMSMRIVDDDGAVVEEGVIGALEVRGPSVTVGYWQSLAGDREGFTPDGWFKTGDCGFIRTGRLSLTGRSKDVVIIHGRNHFCHEIEAVVEGIEGIAVAGVAVCGVRQPGHETDDLVIFFTPVDPAEERLPGLLREIRRGVVRSVGVTPTAVIPLERQAIPRTEIGKIRRAELRRRFEAGAFEAIRERLAGRSQQTATPGPARSARITKMEAVIATLWCDVLSLDGVGLHEDFFELGGNSLRLLQLQRSVQACCQKDIPLRDLIEHTSVAAMAAYLSEVD